MSQYQSPLGQEFQYGMGALPEVDPMTPGGSVYGSSPQEQAYNSSSGQEEELIRRIMQEEAAKRYGGGGVLGMTNSALAAQGGIGGVAAKGVKALAGLF